MISHHIDPIGFECPCTTLCKVLAIISIQQIVLLHVNTSRQSNEIGVSWTAMRVDMLKTVWFASADMIWIKFTRVGSNTGC